MDITELKENEQAVVSEIKGGHGLINKLDSLGLRQGVKITKVSKNFMGGPVVLKAGSTQVAIGYGMAKKILVDKNKPLKKVFLVGNPNVGKSVVFSRLTGVNVISSNYPGTTVEFTKGYIETPDEKYEVIDVPGIYSLDPSSKAEEVAVEMLKEDGIILNVIDSTNLERNLNLTLQLLEKKMPMIIILNFFDEIKHIGISIDNKKLEEIINVPVISACAVSGEGIKEIAARIGDAKISNFEYDPQNKWNVVGKIVEQVQKVTHKHHTFLERLSDITIKPVTGIPFALALLSITFFVVRFIGEGLINYVFDPLFNNIYLPLITKLAGQINIGFIKQLLIGVTPEVMKSFGVLTTGIYIPVAVVLPYIFAFYLVMSLLEDFGYLPRLAVLLDSVMHNLGLHGYSTIPIILGLGCKVPALLATRILETEKEKVISIVLILLCSPCMPQTTMILSIGMHYGMKAVAAIFIIIFFVAIVTTVLLNRFMKGEVPELFVEIPPYRIPKFNVILKKLWIRLYGFLTEAVPMIIVGVFVVNVFDILGIIKFVSGIFVVPVKYFLGLPPETVSVMFLGFLRKDVSIALLAPFSLTAGQFVVASVFLVMYLPCIAMFFTLIKEMGIKTSLKIVTLTFVIAFTTAALLRLIINQVIG